MGPRHTIAIRSAAGRERLDNQDLAAAGTDLVVVADGMGGTRGGAVAARIACAAILEAVDLRGGFEAAAARMAVAPGGDPDMGATVAAVRLGDGAAELAHAGDVRVYVLRTGAPPTAAAPRYAPAVTLASGATMVCVTRDHTSIRELVERGHLTAEGARSHPLRGRVRRAVRPGGADPELGVVALVPGDRLVVCTDGVWGAIDGDTLAAAVEAGTPDDACAAVLRAVAGARGVDDATIAIIECRGAPS